MEIENSLYDRQDEAGGVTVDPLAWRSQVVPLEDALQLGLGDAVARVGEAQRRALGLAAQIAMHFTPGRRVLHRIAQEIFQHSLHQADIGFDQVVSRLHRDPEFDAVLFCLQAELLHHVMHELRHRERGRTWTPTSGAPIRFHVVIRLSCA